MRATVLIDGASVTILPRRAPVGESGPIRGRALAIFAGDRPTTNSAAPDVTYDATVEPEGRGFAVLDLGEAEAVVLARSLDLAEILYWDGRRAREIDCSERPVT